jgi:hypothetical protein
VQQFKRQFPDAIVGGTHDVSDRRTVEDVLGIDENAPLDYSIAFTQRGCRLKCPFCVVPTKEGGPRSVNRIAEIWRGDPYPRHLHLLDNDFFGQSREQWQARIVEIRSGGFKVCLNQGINVRLLDDEAAGCYRPLRGLEYPCIRRVAKNLHAGIFCMVLADASLCRITQAQATDYWVLTSLYQERSNVSDLALDTSYRSIEYHPFSPRTLQTARSAGFRDQDCYSLACVNHCLRNIAHHYSHRSRFAAAVGLSREQPQLQAAGRRWHSGARAEQHGQLYLDPAPGPIHRADLAP